MKRILSLLLTVVMLMGAVVTASAYSDVSTSASYAGAVEKLTALGIVSGSKDQFFPNATLTREQFAKMIVIATNQSDSVSQTSTPFSDVPASRWSSGYISLANSSGYITGLPNGTFGPNGSVTWGQAITIAVRALGYTDDDLTGNWPTNYVTKAKSLALTDGLTFNASAAIPRWAAAVILSRALDTDVKSDSTATASLAETAGLYEEVLVLADDSVASGLASDEIRTPDGTCRNTSGTDLSVGSSYLAKVENGVITAVYGTAARTESMLLASYENGTATWKTEDGLKTMTLPSSVQAYDNDGTTTVSDLDLMVGQTAVLGYDADTAQLEYVMVTNPTGASTGTYKEALILGTGATDEDVQDNEIVTDLGTYTVAAGVAIPTAGTRVGLFVNGSTVTGIYGQLNSVRNATVLSAAATSVKVSTVGSAATETMTLPSTITYWHDGAEVSYANLSSSLDMYTSIVFGYAANGTDLSYAVLFDPIYGDPQVADAGVLYTKTIGDITLSDSQTIVRNGDVAKLKDIEQYDVAYEVSDIWGRYSYVEIYDALEYGTILAYTPTRYAPQTLTMSVYQSSSSTNVEKTFTFADTFDLSSLTTAAHAVGKYVTVLIGRDGEVVKML